MADIALRSMGKIIDIGLKIKEAVETVKQNDTECRDIENCVARVNVIIDCLRQTVTRFDEVTPVEEEPAINKDNFMMIRNELDDLADSMERALKLVTKCQRKHVVGRFTWAGKMAKKLGRVQDDILCKLMRVSTATNIAQLGFTLTIIAPQNRNDGRSQIVETNEVATGSGVSSDPLSGLTKFNLSELKVATHNFSKENKIGHGICATVFKGFLRSGRVVAVKDFDAGARPTMHYNNEIIIGVKLQHKNVVKTLGYCLDEKVEKQWSDGRELETIHLRCLLVTGYLPNRSLDMTIRGGTKYIFWPCCFQIIKGIAQGLNYLHEQNIVHHDIKPENIVFDSDMNPVIIDFGLSVVLDNGVDHIMTTDVSGTFGFIPPEYIKNGVLSKKYDVFSFGVVIRCTIFGACVRCEIQDSSDDKMDDKWIVPLLEDVDQMRKLFEPTVVEESEIMDAARCLKVGLLCSEIDPADRPTMAEVLEMLNGKKEVPAPKNEPSIDSSSSEEEYDEMRP